MKESVIKGLWSRANHPGTPTEEAKTCHKLINHLRAKYGDTVDDILRGLREEENSHKEIRWKHEYQQRVLIHLAFFLGLEPKHWNSRSGPRPKLVLCDGPLSLLVEWEIAYEHHVSRMEMQIDMLITGYMHGVAPYAMADDDDREEKSFTEEERAAFLSAYEQGMRNRHMEPMKRLN